MSTEISRPLSETELTWRVAQKLAVSAFMPKQLRDGMSREQVVANAFAAIMTGHELGIGPMSSLRHVQIINGQPTLSAALQMALLRRHGHRIEILYVGVDRVQLRGTSPSGEVMEVSYTIEEARKAGLVKPQSGWDKHPEDMLWARCTSRLARRLDPEATLALYAPEDLADQVQTITVRPTDHSAVLEEAVTPVTDEMLQELPLREEDHEGEPGQDPLPEVRTVHLGEAADDDDRAAVGSAPAGADDAGPDALPELPLDGTLQRRAIRLNRALSPQRKMGRRPWEAAYKQWGWSWLVAASERSHLVECGADCEHVREVD